MRKFNGFIPIDEDDSELMDDMLDSDSDSDFDEDEDEEFLGGGRRLS